MPDRGVEFHRVLTQKEPSPCKQMTCASGLAALAPTANGNPTPIVPNGPN